VDEPWTSYLVGPDGDVTVEFGIICAALVLLAWIGVAVQGQATPAAGAVHRCPTCRRPTAFQRRPGPWVPLVAGLSWGALLWAHVPSLARWLAPTAIWGLLVALHPKRCAVCRSAMRFE
jgi:hypothetical protein